MLNKVVLIGRLTKDPELRFTPSGVGVATFTLAVERQFSRNGEKKTYFIPIVARKKQAENCAEYVKKGSLVAVDGRIQTRNYDNNEGKKVYVTEVVADSVKFLEKKKSEVNETKSNPIRDPFENSKEVDISDSDLPF